MKAHILIFLFTSFSLCAMEENLQSIDLDSENSSIETQLNKSLSDASAMITLSSKTIIATMGFGLVLLIWGAIDKTYGLTPWGEIEVGAGVGLWVGPALSIVPTTWLAQAINRAKKIISPSKQTAVAIA